MKLNLLPWLKKSPAKPTYSTSQKKKENTDAVTSESGENVYDAKNDKDIVHRFMYFYQSDLLDIPEFRFDNKLESFKAKDIEMLVDYLTKKEEYEK